MADTPVEKERRTAGQAVAELRAITTTLRLGGFDTLRDAEITRSRVGTTVTIRTGRARGERS